MRRETALSCVGLAVLLSVAGLRLRAITDDRTWWDEDSVVLDGHAIPWFGHPLRAFHHRDLDLAPLVTRVVAGLRENDVYPPVVPLTVFALRPFPHPILAVRTLLFAVGLSLVILVFWLVRRVSGLPAALVALSYVGFNPQLMETSQQINWSALVPALATVATALLLSLRERQSQAKWGAYVLSMLLLVNTHYFSVWIVPAHLAFAWKAPLDFSRPLLCCLVAVVAFSTPWFLWAIPSQQRWLDAYFKVFFAGRPYDDWYQPFTLRNLITGYGYTIAAAGGLQPSPIRTRYLIPLLPVLAYAVVRAARSPNVTVRRWTFLAIAPWVVGLVGQTAYSWRAGNTIRMASTYLIAWLPLVLVGIVYGLLEIRSVAVRRTLIGAVLGLVVMNGLLVTPNQFEPKQGSLGNYRSVVTYLGQLAEADTAIVHRTDRRAKIFNLFYAGSALQLVMPVGDVPAGVSRLALLSNVEDPSVEGLSGWTPFEEVFRAGYTTVMIARRTPQLEQPTRPEKLKGD